MIVTIDGPAGAGKSTVARRLARNLGFRFLDTGAMYRAITVFWLAHDSELNSPEFQSFLDSVEIDVSPEAVRLNGKDVTNQIRSIEVTEAVSTVADSLPIRTRLVALQRRIAGQDNFVCEGRDQGTVVFPDAGCKLFLTASEEVRAQRRAAQLTASGEAVTNESVLKQQRDRDQRDQSREVGRLERATDAVEVITDGLNLDEVLVRVELIAREKLGLPLQRSENS